MTDGQDVRALLESIGGLRRRIAEMDRQAEQMRAMNAGRIRRGAGAAGRSTCGRSMPMRWR